MGETDVNSSSERALLRMGRSFFDVSDNGSVEHEPTAPTFQCTSCKESFANDTTYNSHLRTNCGQDPLLQSQLGSNKTAITALGRIRRPTVKYNGKTVTCRCSLCPTTFSDEISYKLHVEIDHSNKAGSFYCSVCKKSFSCKQGLRRHIQLNCGKKKIRCFYCLREFKSEHTSWKHMFFKHASEIAGDKNLSLECTACHLVFQNKAELSDHVKSAKPKGPVTGPSYVCSRCRTPFISQIVLNRHMCFCRNTRVFQCFHCSRKFTTKYHLQYHILSAHYEIVAGGSGCSKSGNDKSDRVELVKIEIPQVTDIKEDQTEELPHRTHDEIVDGRSGCSNSGNDFSDFEIVKNESVQVNDIKGDCTEDRPKSPKCDDRTLMGARAVKSRRFECTNCHKFFKDEHFLLRHVSIDCGREQLPQLFDKSTGSLLNSQKYFFEPTTGAFICAQCNKSYYAQHHFRRHLAICKAGGEFRCPQCPSKFLTEDHLQYHINSIHHIGVTSQQ